MTHRGYKTMIDSIEKELSPTQKQIVLDKKNEMWNSPAYTREMLMAIAMRLLAECNGE